MRNWKWLSVAVAIIIGIVFALHAQREVKGPSASHPYSAAFVTPKGLIVFPFNAARVTIALPVAIGRLAYGPDGISLYTGADFTDPNRAGLFRVDIKSGQVSAIPGSSGFQGADSLAVSARKDKIVISGGNWQRRHLVACGIFELSIPSGDVRTVNPLETTGCDYLSTWHDISLSPNAEQAVADRKGRVELIDLRRGTITPIGPGQKAAWSPDGKWIAMLDNTRNYGISLMDASDFSKRRHLGNTDDQELVWSPDSRYLLLWKSELLCGGYFGTFEILDVNTGGRAAIQSSRCAVNLMTAGWVSEELTR